VGVRIYKFIFNMGEGRINFPDYWST